MHIRRDISFEENTIEGGEGMKLKVGYEKIKGFSNPVKKAEEVNEWGWWALFGAVVVMEVMFILKVLGKI